MESQRQKKIGGIIQKDLSEIILKSLKESGRTGIIISVTNVKITPDLMQCRAHLSIYPEKYTEAVMEEIYIHQSQIKHEVAQRTRHQLRRMPSLEFFLDDSLAKVDDIEQALKGKENPIENPDLLDSRKKK
jgi:ribosome-binding factor A